MKTSPNYNLALIEDIDAFSAESLNQNFTLIDALFKKLIPSGVILNWYGTEANCPEILDFVLSLGDVFNLNMMCRYTDILFFSYIIKLLYKRRYVVCREAYLGG